MICVPKFGENLDPTTSEEDRRGAINNIYTHMTHFITDSQATRRMGGGGGGRRKREKAFRRIFLILREHC